MKKNKKILSALIFNIILAGGIGLILFFYSDFFGELSARGDETSLTGIITVEGETISSNSNEALSDEGLADNEASINAEALESQVTLMAVGDNLMHMGVVYTGKTAQGDYDFTSLYDGILDLLNKADIKVINQETIFGGDELGFSGYPKFNSPTSVGDALHEVGFNVVLNATNHTADQGIAGINNCQNFWKKYPDMCILGFGELYGDTTNFENNYNLSENDTQNEESDFEYCLIDKIPIIKVNGISFAVLNYTYGPNMETIPSTIVGHLNLLCPYNESNRLDFTRLDERVIENIKKADELADFVLVFPHWGTEYSTTVSAYQTKFALEMTKAGADVIIGTHPHVVEPVEWVKADNGNESLCFYSLGNYVSTQKDPISMLEAMAYVTFTISEDGPEINLENTGVIPMVCQYTDAVRIDKVYMLEDYTDELAASHGIRSYGGKTLKLEDLKKWASDILGDFMISYKDILD